MKNYVSDDVNLMAHAISEWQYCSSCAGLDPEKEHCVTCTKEAIIALKALSDYHKREDGKKFLTFQECVSKGKTKIFRIASFGDSCILGFIKWHSAWRRYCFFPAGDVLFDHNCLMEIDLKILQLMEEREK